MKNLYTDIYDMKQAGLIKDPDIVRKTELKVWVAIILGTISVEATILGIYYGMSNKFDLLAQEVRTNQQITTAEIDKKTNQIISLEGRYGLHDREITTMQALMHIK